MLRHADIWHAIDALARQNGLSASGLARRAGLDPTTFNKSKRVTPGGRKRWPGTESVSKVLDATHCSLGNFVALFGGTGDGVVLRIPIIGYAEAGRSGYFDAAGYPVVTGWDDILFPDIGDANAFALEISGDGMAPVYRDGDTIIVSPAADIRRGDRIVVKTAEGEVMVKELTRKTARKLELGSVNAAHSTIGLNVDDIVWMSRIVWVNQ